MDAISIGLNITHKMQFFTLLTLFALTYSVAAAPVDSESVELKKCTVNDLVRELSFLSKGYNPFISYQLKPRRDTVSTS